MVWKYSNVKTDKINIEHTDSSMKATGVFYVELHQNYDKGHGAFLQILEAPYVSYQ